MRRPLVSTIALALALLPAAARAQTPQQPQQPQPQPQQPTQQQPTQPQTQQPQGQQQATTEAAKLTFKTNVGMLLVQVKPDQTAAFEEMITKLRTGAAASTEEAIRAAGTLKVYKSADPGAGGNAFYVLLYDPATPGTEYSWLDVINKTLTPEQQRDPATREMYQRYAAAIASTNILNLTEVK